MDSCNKVMRQSEDVNLTQLFPPQNTDAVISRFVLQDITTEDSTMGKGLAILGLILIIVGLLPVLSALLGLAILDQVTTYLFMLNLYSMNLGGYLFSETMLILIGLGAVLLIVGIIK